MPNISISKDPPMIVFKPPVLEAIVGIGMIATAIAQAVTDTVPQPAGDIIMTLLTAGGIGGVLAWGVKQVVGSVVKTWEESRATDRKQRDEDRAADRAYVQRLEQRLDQLIEHYKEQSEKETAEKHFWRDKALEAMAGK